MPLLLLLLLSLSGRAVALGCGAAQTMGRQVFCIEDDAKKGVLLGSVIPQKRMRSLFGAQWERATFAFLEGNTAVQRYFTLDAVRGHLRLARDLDRDRLCEEAEVCCLVARQCRLELKAVVNVPAERGPHIEAVPVLVLDKNDHAPRFPKPRTELTVAENARRGHELALPLASDPDSLQLSVKDYFVPNGLLPEEFVLDKRRSSVGPAGSRYRRISRLMLRLDRELDRERRANYTFPLVAVDGGRPAFSGTTTVLVRVLDHNDNGPRFLRASYDAVVDEGRFPITPLLTVKAEDPDAGRNAKTRYEFAPGTDDETRSLFDVRPDSGEILLKQQLDYEKATRHKFSVIAIDKAGHADTATTAVTIRVRDRNDERPTISVGYVAGTAKGVDTKQGKKVARIKENGGSRQFVAILTVKDRDRGQNGRVNCSLTNHRTDFLLELDRERRTASLLYMVYTGRALDREKQDRIDLQVRCQDAGRPLPQTAELVLPVELIDENDNKPTLRLLGTHARSTVRVKENMAKGTKVIQVLAEDPDMGANSDLTFSMALSDRRTQALFRIDPKTGQITTRQSIDREAGDSPIDSLPVIVTVRDHGKPAHTSTLSLTIAIVDINDNAPNFVDSPMYFTLKENQPANYRVGEIRLVDKDVVDQINVRLDYARNGATLPFRVYREKEKFFLNTTASLDRERRAEYKFFIIAEDVTSSGSYRTSGQVHVSVLDVNDNTPQIIFPRLSNKSIHLSYREQKGFEVLSINARDNDDSKDDSGKCFFELTPESTDILEIDPRSGTIRVRRALQESDIGPHRVCVVVRDNGQPPRSSFVRFTIVVDRSKPHRRHRDLPAPPPARPGLPWRSDITLIVVLVLIILLLLGIVLLIVYVRHWRHGFLFLPDLLSPCHRSSAGQKRRRAPPPDLMKPDHPGDKYLHEGATLGRACDFKMRPGDVKEVPKASSDTCSFSGLYSGTPTRQHPGVTTPFLPRDNSKYESLDPQRQAFLQQQQRAHLQLGTGPRGRSSLPDSKAPDLTKRDYDSLLRGPDHYHVYQTISPGEALVDDADLPPGATLGKRYAGTLRRQSSAQSRPLRYNSDGDLTAGPMEEHVGPRNASVKFVFPPKTEQVYTKTYPVMQTSFV